MAASLWFAWSLRASVVSTYFGVLRPREEAVEAIGVSHATRHVWVQAKRAGAALTVTALVRRCWSVRSQVFARGPTMVVDTSLDQISSHHLHVVRQCLVSCELVYNQHDMNAVEALDVGRNSHVKSERRMVQSTSSSSCVSVA